MSPEVAGGAPLLVQGRHGGGHHHARGQPRAEGDGGGGGGHGVTGVSVQARARGVQARLKTEKKLYCHILWFPSPLPFPGA